MLVKSVFDMEVDAVVKSKVVYNMHGLEGYVIVILMDINAESMDVTKQHSILDQSVFDMRWSFEPMESKSLNSTFARADV